MLHKNCCLLKWFFSQINFNAKKNLQQILKEYKSCGENKPVVILKLRQFQIYERNRKWKLSSKNDI